MTKIELKSVSIVDSDGNVLLTGKSQKLPDVVCDTSKVRGGRGSNEMQRTVNGDEFITTGLKHLCKANNIPFDKTTKIDHITYTKGTNNNYDYKMIREITHDGTLLFEHKKLIEMFYEIARRETSYVNWEYDYEETIYHIGDVVIYSTYDVEASRSCPRMSQRFELPIKLVRRGE